MKKCQSSLLDSSGLLGLHPGVLGELTGLSGLSSLLVSVSFSNPISSLLQHETDVLEKIPIPSQVG